MEKLLEGVGIIIIGLVMIPAAITLLALLLVKLLGLMLYVGPVIAPLCHFAFRLTPVAIIGCAIVDPEDMFAYLALLGFWVPYYVLTTKRTKE